VLRDEITWNRFVDHSSPPLGAERPGEVGDSRGLRLPHLIPAFSAPNGAEKENGDAALVLGGAHAIHGS
jgi:hypothetical protein